MDVRSVCSLPGLPVVHNVADQVVLGRQRLPVLACSSTKFSRMIAFHGDSVMGELQSSVAVINASMLLS